MRKTDQERIFIYRRMISKNSKLSFLVDFTDSQLLDILNSSVLPNSISKSNFKYSFFYQLLINPKDTMTIVKKFDTLLDIFTRTEKDIFKFGLFHGFDSYSASYQFSRFVKMSTDISEGELVVKKKISSSFFEGVFDFAYKVIYKGEQNGQFPRI